jgi:uncharacterized protein YggU (UPF0235/DUF167 family)
VPLLLRLKVHAAARQDRIDARGPAAYEAWVRAKPEGGKANAAVLALLARQLGVEAKRLRIVKGAASPSKLVTVLGG